MRDPVLYRSMGVPSGDEFQNLIAEISEMRDPGIFVSVTLFEDLMYPL